AFMCAETSVKLAMHFRKRLGAGLFGGEGFILQKITGPGTVFLEIGGEVRDYTLQPGQVMKVDPGHIALYEPTVQYDVTTVKGVTNILFGGEGLFLATLTGPGRVWLQSLPLSNLAAKLHRYMPAKG
ncbi:MAG: TIGR00266 family protein, partial [Chloroflexota bacterium]